MYDNSRELYLGMLARAISNLFYVSIYLQRRSQQQQQQHIRKRRKHARLLSKF